MTPVYFLYPHQCFHHPFPHGARLVLIEDPLFFYDPVVDIPFHQIKLTYHRAAMKAYAQAMVDKGYSVTYIDFGDALKKEWYGAYAHQSVRVFDVVDDYLEQRLTHHAKQHAIRLEWLSSPNFITDRETLSRFFKNRRFFMRDFYQFQRHRLNILMDGDAPQGGQYSFDSDNRKKMPLNQPVPPFYQAPSSPILTEAISYVQTHFGHHVGDATQMTYPYTRAQALEALDDFITQRFDLYGPYQDAIDARHELLFHARLSSALNIGLLSPMEVVDAALNADVPLASKEGFIRQIIGWREFMRASYVLKGRTLRTSNQLGHTQRLPASVWSASTGLDPLDDTLKKTYRTAYAHHIERLMIVGNAFLLLRIHPDEVYRWFMINHIDAYDWVMVPNVYAMSQNASSFITTKPYFSGANYLLKMSHYRKGAWSETWDALFYLFLKTHETTIAKNPRLSMLLMHLRKKTPEELQHYRTLTHHLL